MNQNQIKMEPIDNSMEKSSPRLFICEKCEIRFSNHDTLNAHRHHYCRTNTKRNTHLIDSTPMKGVKRQLIDDYSAMPMKRLAIWKLNNPIERMIYIPIQNQPLNLSKPKSKSIYCCEFCSIHFFSLKTLQAHQQNYCTQFKSYQIRKQALSHSILLKCTKCCAMFDNKEKYFDHIDSVHTNERFIECLEYPSTWNLIQHMNLLRTNIRSERNLQTYFSCLFCQIKFQQIETLEEHMKNYCKLRFQKPKPLLTCSSCQIVFQHQDSYRIHQTFYCPNRRTTN